MAVPDPTTLEFIDRVNSAGDSIARGLEITDADVKDVAENAFWAYAQGDRRVFLELYPLDEITKACVSYTTVRRAAPKFPVGRRRLRIWIRGRYLTPRVLIKDRTMGSTYVTWTGTGIGATVTDQFADVGIGTLAVGAKIVIELQLQDNTASTELHACRIHEISLESADL